MLSLFLNAALAADRTQTEESYWQMWQDWHAKGDRWLPEILNADEHNTRFEIFKDNVDKITRHNKEGHPWTMGLTPFADMTGKEFKNNVVGNVCADDFQANAKLNSAKTKLREGRRMAVEAGSNPTSIDWVSQGKVSEVKNQGQCGSCWAFSTTGAIESRCAIAKGEAVQLLSEQELVDCDDNDHGCNGGAMQNGFLYAETHGGLCSESEYAYEGSDGTCQSSGCTHYDAITTYTSVSQGESYLETAVAGGPVSIAIEADQDTFQLYTGGVLTATGCGTQLDHGVLVVGYDNTAGTKYWKVKNSWGASWGESGYIRLCKGCDMNDGGGQCGILMDPSYPTC